MKKNNIASLLFKQIQNTITKYETETFTEDIHKIINELAYNEDSITKEFLNLVEKQTIIGKCVNSYIEQLLEYNFLITQLLQ